MMTLATYDHTEQEAIRQLLLGNSVVADGHTLHLSSGAVLTIVPTGYGDWVAWTNSVEGIITNVEFKQGSGAHAVEVIAGDLVIALFGIYATGYRIEVEA